MRRAIVIVLPVFGFLLPTSRLVAQTGSLRVSLPSPTAASLGKFGDVPVSLYTGVPDITIPLFTAKGRTLELPIVLKYHAGGIRVEEIGGWVGIGWALEPGGVITRTVRGVVDEHSSGYYNTGWTFYSGSNWSSPSQTLITNIANGSVDGEPDQFFFSMAGRAGQFVMGPTTADPSFREVRAVPYQKLRIEPIIGTSITSFVITSEDGTRYTFSAAETSADLVNGEWSAPYTSSWHLTDIRSPGGDVISLFYTPYTARHQLASYRESFHFVDGECSLPPPDVTTDHETQVQRLDSIKTAAHTIHFIKAAALRSDALSPNGAQQEPRLEKITVKTPSGVVLRTFRFEHDYSTGRLTLTNLYEEDRNGVPLPPYSFAYSGPQLPGYSSYSQDHWGYYNGKSNLSGLLPTTTTPSGVVIEGADRSPDPAYMKAGVLTRITYPTGGYNDFIYEANDYGAIGPGAAVPVGPGPNQMAELEWPGPPAPAVDTTFTVGGIAPVTATVLAVYDQPDCFQVECSAIEILGVNSWQQPGTYYVTLQPNTTYTLRITNTGEARTYGRVEWNEMVQRDKVTGGGLRVAEIRAGDGMGITTTRKYWYTLQSDPSRSSGIIGVVPKYDHEYAASGCYYYSRSSISKMPLGAGTSGQVAYREVTVWHGPNGEFGRTRHTFRTVTEAPDGGTVAVWPWATRTSNEWARGQQLQVTESNAAGQIQREVASSHGFPSEPITNREFLGMSVHSFSAGLYGSPGSAYYYNPFKVISAWSHPSAETISLYDETGINWLSTSRIYAYGNPNHAQLTQLTETNSDGTRRITRMKYPADYANNGTDAVGAALAAMQGSAHMHSPVIERWVTEKVGGIEKLAEAELTTFKEFLAGQFLPYQRFVLNIPSVP